MIINLNEFGTGGGGVDPQEVQEIVADYTYSKVEVDEKIDGASANEYQIAFGGIYSSYFTFRYIVNGIENDPSYTPRVKKYDGGGGSTTVALISVGNLKRVSFSSIDANRVFVIEIMNGANVLYSETFTLASLLQPKLTSGTDIKTINGESILGSGNIVVGGDETDPIWTAEKVNYYTKAEVDEKFEGDREYLNLDYPSSDSMSRLWDINMSVFTSSMSSVSILYNYDEVNLYTDSFGRLGYYSSSLDAPILMYDKTTGRQYELIEEGITVDPSAVYFKLNKVAITINTEDVEYNKLFYRTTKEEITEYVKTATKSDDGTTLTLTKQDGTEVVFTPSTGGDLYYIGFSPNYATNKFALYIMKNGENITNASVSVYLYENNGRSSVSISKSGIWYYFQYFSTSLAAEITISVGGVKIYSTLVPIVQNLQQKLNSGSNIKTINGQSLLGSGNIEIQGGGEVEETIVHLEEKIADLEIRLAALEG